LTGYVDPPAGVESKEGLHYNPYFNGGWIGMAKALYDDVIEYSDGNLVLFYFFENLIKLLIILKIKIDFKNN
jgi:cytochrome c1